MHKQLVSWGIFILLCLIWGSSFKLMHDSQYGLNAAQIAAVRISSAALVFLPFGLFYIWKIPRSKIVLVILSAVFGNLLPAFLFAAAIMKTDSSLAGILNSLTPICVVVISIVFFRDHISRQKLTGVLVGFFGLVLLTLLPVFIEHKTISTSHFEYTLMIVVATLFYGINVNLVGHYLKNLNPVHVSTVSISAMLIPAGVVLWQQGFFQLNFHEPALRNAIGSSIILGIAGTAIATVLFYILIKRGGGLFASLVTYGVPFVALMWGFIDGEKISFPEILCLLLILSGVYLANKKETKKA